MSAFFISLAFLRKHAHFINQDVNKSITKSAEISTLIDGQFMVFLRVLPVLFTFYMLFMMNGYI